MNPEEHVLAHYGKKGMKWGTTRKDTKAMNKALSPKGHKERQKRNDDPKNQRRQNRIEIQTDTLVQRALAKPMSKITIATEDRTLVVNGRDFAEVVIGRVDGAHISPFQRPQYVTKN